MIDRRSLPSDNNNSFVGVRNTALDDRAPLASFDVSLGAANINRAVLLEDVELIQGVESWRVLDISATDIEACCRLLIAGIMILRFRILQIAPNLKKGGGIVNLKKISPPCQGQVIRPSGATTPNFNGAP